MIKLARILYNYGDEDYEELSSYDVVLMTDQDDPLDVLVQCINDNIVYNDRSTLLSKSDLKSIKDYGYYMSWAIDDEVWAIVIEDFDNNNWMTESARHYLKLLLSE